MSYAKWNNYLGWLSFAIALFVYLSTIEPSFSFWDCAEYIAAAAKLEVTHSPGAATFQIIGAVFSLLAFGDGGNYPVIINAMSALFSALTILFMFWILTHFIAKLVIKNEEDKNDIKNWWIVFGGAFIGCLAFTFSDTFWFSAVEGEVYSMASLFTALLLWLTVKWENETRTRRRLQYIILISFIIGLSVGVHMMVMLAIPAVGLMIYFNTHAFTWKNFLWANLVIGIIFGIIFKVIFPVTMWLFGSTEIFFVNKIGLPFNSGLVFSFIVLFLLFYFGISYSQKKQWAYVNTALLSISFMLIGFSSWMMIGIRANANPPMNLNNPDSAIGMLDYYNREQYGEWPVLYGANYTAYLDRGGFSSKDDGPIYEKDEEKGIYVETGRRYKYVFDKRHESILPRMYNPDPTVMDNYVAMYGFPELYIRDEYKGEPQIEELFQEVEKRRQNEELTIDEYREVSEYIGIERPSLADNLNFLFTYQIGYMFVRYLMWNFSGRQNDIDGQYQINKGNWITGIPFLDEPRLGDQDKLPKQFKNKSTNAYFLLPFLLGIIGFFYQLNFRTNDFYIFLSLFLLGSVGIILYTSVKPFEPRERDYALVSAFFVFAMWIGIGAAFLIKLVKEKFAKGVQPVFFVLLAIPVWMGFTNWDDHDRSRRYAAHDYAYSCLVDLEPNAILFVYGDNDTYPLWGIQETYGFRTDVKVVNFTLLGTGWNIAQVRRRTYDAPPIPGSMLYNQYRDGVNDMVRVLDKSKIQEAIDFQKEEGEPYQGLENILEISKKDSLTAKEAIDFITKHPNRMDAIEVLYGERINDYNLLPVKKIIVPVNKENCIKYGIVAPEDKDLMEDYLVINIRKKALRKNTLAMLDMLASYNWDRPIYFSNGGVYDNENLFFLKDYLQFQGFNYKLVPIKTPESEDGVTGRVNANSLYKTIKKFKWGNFKDPKAYFDETCKQNIVGYRMSVARCSEELMKTGQKAKAREILDLVNREIPIDMYPASLSMNSIIYSYLMIGDEKKGLELANKYRDSIFEELDFYQSLQPSLQFWVKKDMQTLYYHYAFLVDRVLTAYKKLGQKDRAEKFIQDAIKPIDERFKKAKAKLRSPKQITQLIENQYMPFLEVISETDSEFVKAKLKQLQRE